VSTLIDVAAGPDSTARAEAGTDGSDVTPLN
jgi:hypothetical protein